jgi:cephalosporin hydroxylase
MLLSVIIPARNEKYLKETIENVLENIEGDTEIIAILDGYWPDPPIQDNPRVKIIHHTEAIGQRQSINEAARMSEAKFIMKLDAHCAVDKGFDVKLAEDCEYDWTVIPRMYNLDVETWTPKTHKRTDYMYMGLNEKNELRALYYGGNEWKSLHRKTELIDDTMACMGPGWFMHRDRFWELGGCDEGHGSWGQQGIEVACKAWLSGGSLKVNKKTWFAHYFRGGDGGFPYEIKQKDINHARKYSKDLWMNNKWDKQIRKFDWMLDRFNPPGWDAKSPAQVAELSAFFYRHIHLMKREPSWRGVRVIKMPSDMILYAEVIQENKPDFIIDSGTKFGGSALYYQDMLDLVGNGGKVISIDKYPVEKVKDQRVTYIEAGSTSESTLKTVKEMVGDKKVMVVLDSDHRRQHVKRELHFYAPIVTPGQYMVVEDCYDRNGLPTGPAEARDWFLRVNKDFKQTNLDSKYLIGYCRGGWLRKNG